MVDKRGKKDVEDWINKNHHKIKEEEMKCQKEANVRREKCDG